MGVDLRTCTLRWTRTRGILIWGDRFILDRPYIGIEDILPALPGFVYVQIMESEEARLFSSSTRGYLGRALVAAVPTEQAPTTKAARAVLAARAWAISTWLTFVGHRRGGVGVGTRIL